MLSHPSLLTYTKIQMYVMGIVEEYWSARGILLHSCLLSVDGPFYKALFHVNLMAGFEV